MGLESLELQVPGCVRELDNATYALARQPITSRRAAYVTPETRRVVPLRVFFPLLLRAPPRSSTPY